MKVCIIYNGAPHYRAGIFSLIDQNYDCDWFIAQGYGNIKQLSLDFFKNAKSLDMKYIRGALCYQPGYTRLLLSKKYDVFLVLGDFTNLSTWVGLPIHNIFNPCKKVYFWSHGILRIRKWPRAWFNKLFFKLPYATFTYGDRAKKIMTDLGFNKEKLFPIHNSLNYNEQLSYRGNYTDIYKIHFQNELPVLFFIGRLTPEKKLHMIIDAMQILRNEEILVNCIFIGEGSEKLKLQQLSEQYGLTNNVWFYGACYNEKEKSELIGSADLCISPGNIGLTAMDSLVYGTPVITMDNFDMQMPEFESIKENVTGLFFKENDVFDLSKKIKTWLHKFPKREEIRHNCYNEIDTMWNPYYQLKVLSENLKE